MNHYLSTLKKLIIITSCLLAFNANSAEKVGRLGVGMTNQANINNPGISFKLQKSKSFAFGGLFAIDTDSNSGGHAAAIKLYRNLFEEPQLYFYGSVLAGILGQKTQATSTSGFQFDFTLGSEFSFQGLNSIGFSFEFGVSMTKLDDFTISTVGSNFITAGIHFYL